MTILLVTMKVGDIVKPHHSVYKSIAEVEGYNYGVILDVYEDDYGILYYEVHWDSETEWWKEGELRLISDAEE